MVNPTYSQVLDTCDRKTDVETLVRDMLARVGDKWTMLAIENLAAGPLRFTSLQRSMAGISHRVLTVTLRALERDGLVKRTVYPESPPRVEYQLTSLGKEMIPPVLGLITWIQDNRVELSRHQRASESDEPS